MTSTPPRGTELRLSDFQRATAKHAFRRLYRDHDSSRRFLVADETGLGKTHVAQETIAQTLKHLQGVDHVRRIDIVYVCSNADIAAQNIRKLDVTDSQSPSFATRLSLLITQPDVLEPRRTVRRSRPPSLRSRRRHPSSSAGNSGRRRSVPCSTSCWAITWD